MRWQKLLFCHWEVDPASLRPLVPEPLELDLFEDRAYVGIVPFAMSGIRFRGLPEIPGTHSFLELNVRTYVRYEGRQGVWFHSLDANNRLAVRAARAWFHLRYLDCDLTLVEHEGRVRYTARRPGSAHEYRTYPTPGAAAAGLDVQYRPVGPKEPSDLDRFLTERYCLYSYSSKGRLYQGNVHHEPWPLQSAEADFDENRMVDGLGLALSGPAMLLYSESLDVFADRPRRLP
ncbi:MAG: YqjF family protein [Fimbriimonadaceae bacterium]